MSAVEDVKRAIRKLSREDFSEIRAWFAEHDAVVWDCGFEEDAPSGHFETFCKNLCKDDEEGNLASLPDRPLIRVPGTKRARTERRHLMKKADVFQQGVLAGMLNEMEGGRWRFTYEGGYTGHPVSLTMPWSRRSYDFHQFPRPFEGLLPEGPHLEVMLRRYKLDRTDLFGQLMIVGQDVVGSLTFKEVTKERGQQKTRRQ